MCFFSRVFSRFVFLVFLEIFVVLKFSYFSLGFFLFPGGVFVFFSFCLSVCFEVF